MNEALWRAELINSFNVSTEERRLRELGEEYHRRTEAFDLMTCAHRNERGIAVPISREERRACNLNAYEVETDLLARARDEGIAVGRHGLRRAIQDAAPC
jgi:hypothetical protein